MKVTVEMIDAGARAIYAHEPFAWGDDSHVYETIATADRAQLRAIAAVAIEAALSVADAPAPNDAEFGDAVEQFSIAKDLQCMAAQDGFIGDSRSVNAARVRVLALYADARNAGLEAIKAERRHQERVTASAPSLAFAPHYAIDVLDHLIFALTDGREGRERGRVKIN